MARTLPEAGLPRVLVLLFVLSCSGVHGAALPTAVPVDSRNTPSASPPSVEGHVVDLRGNAVAGAHVVVADIGSYRARQYVTTGAQGEFVFPRTMQAPVLVSAVANGYTAASLPLNEAAKLVLKLPPAGDGKRYAGQVVDTSGRPLGDVRVRLMHWSSPTGQVYYTSTDRNGSFIAELPIGSYSVMVDDPAYISDFASGVDEQRIALVAYRRASVERTPRRDVAKDFCVALEGDRPAEFARSLVDVSVIGLGESTHGTKEYTEWRAEIVSHIARRGELGFVAIEAGWHNAKALDDYASYGLGSAREAVSQLDYWPWRTEEMVAFVERVRAHNVQRPARPVRFIGIDVTYPQETLAVLARESHALGLPPGYLTFLAPLHRIQHWRELPTLSHSEISAMIEGIERLESLFRLGLGGRHTVATSHLSLGLRITRHTLAAARAMPFSMARDKVMADGILELLSVIDEPRLAKVAFWGHNLHVARASIEGKPPAGKYLADALGDRYHAVGTLFYKGAFHAFSPSAKSLVVYNAPPPPEYFLEAWLHSAGDRSACVVDLRTAQGEVAREWLRSPRISRVYGSIEISEDYPWPPVETDRLWSSILFLPVSTPTQLLQQ
jgi:erythromycin esterase